MLLRLLSVLLISLIINACSSSSSAPEFDDNSLDTKAPRVSEFLPLDANIAVENDKAFTVIFSERMDLDSVRDGIKMFASRAERGNEEQIPIEVDISFSEDITRTTNPTTGLEIDVVATVATVRPKVGLLSLDTEYTVQVGPPSKDLSSNKTVDPVTEQLVTGNVMQTDTKSVFTVKRGSWSRNRTSSATDKTQDIVSFTTYSGNEPLAFWSSYTGLNSTEVPAFSIYDIDSLHWESVSGVTDAYESLQIDPDAYGAISALDTSAYSGQGNHFVWSQKQLPFDRTEIFFSHYVDGDWESEAVLVSEPDLTANTLNPRVEMLQNGESLVLWERVSDTDNAIMARVHADGVFGDPFVVSSATDFSINNLKLNCYASVCVLHWIQNDGSQDQLYSRFYFGGIGWQDASIVSQHDDTPAFLAGDVADHDFDLDASGDGFVAWQQYDGFRYNIIRASITGQNYGEPGLLEFNDVADATSPRVAVSNQGGQQYTWLEEGTIWEIHYDSTDDELSEPNELGTQSGDSSIFPIIEYDSFNNLMALWSTGDDANDVFSRRYGDRDQSWSNEAPVGKTQLQSNVNLGVFETKAHQLVPILNDGRLLFAELALVDGEFRLAHTLYDVLNED